MDIPARLMDISVNIHIDSLTNPIRIWAGTLTQPVCKNPADEQYKKYAQFTDQQRAAIGHFLEHLCELGFKDPDSRPMKRSRRYWLQGNA